jgi:hypothetical protein
MRSRRTAPYSKLGPNLATDSPQKLSSLLSLFSFLGRRPCVSWLVETPGVDSTPPAPPDPTDLASVGESDLWLARGPAAHVLPLPRNSARSTEPGWLREGAGGRVKWPRPWEPPRGVHGASHPTHAPRTNFQNCPTTPRPRRASRRTAQRQLAGGDVPRADGSRVRPRRTRLDAVEQHPEATLSRAGARSHHPAPPLTAWENGGSAVLQVWPQPRHRLPPKNSPLYFLLSPFSAAGRPPTSRRLVNQICG